MACDPFMFAQQMSKRCATLRWPRKQLQRSREAVRPGVCARSAAGREWEPWIKRGQIGLISSGMVPMELGYLQRTWGHWGPLCESQQTANCGLHEGGCPSRSCAACPAKAFTLPICPSVVQRFDGPADSCSCQKLTRRLDKSSGRSCDPKSSRMCVY